MILLLRPPRLVWFLIIILEKGQTTLVNIINLKSEKNTNFENVENGK